MKRVISFLTVILIILSACDNVQNTKLEKVKEISSQVKSHFIADGRVKIWETSISESDGKFIIKGATTERQAKDSMLSALDQNNIPYLDSIIVYPNPALGEKTYGITSHSVINLRVNPSYAAESATQTIMGMPLRILDSRSGWLRVVTPEGYIAWVTSGSVTRLNKEEYDKWRDSERYIITTHYTLFVDKPNQNGSVVMDGVWGNIVEGSGRSTGDYIGVKLPDGTQAYVFKHHVEPLGRWIKSRNPNAENIIRTAKQFLGFPYMWGGTSIKAMDCSGFTKTSYYLNGVILARDASQQGYTGDNIDISNGLDNLLPGDLLFFGTKATEKRGERLTHVGIYLGEGEFIHSATFVKINSLVQGAPNYYEGSNRFIRAQRIIGNVDNDKGIASIEKHPWYF